MAGFPASEVTSGAATLRQRLGRPAIEERSNFGETPKPTRETQP
ncbi:MAG: hypothetical protein ACI9VS_004327, partial [Candidatus Binatia bacterium]